jgi:MFS family permease
MLHQKHDPKALRSETTIMPWLIWGLAVAFYAYEFLQRVSISVYAPHLMSNLHIGEAELGVMSSFFYYAYASMQIPAGILIDRLGAKRLATIGIALVTIGSVCFGSIHGVVGGSIARFLIGLGSAFAFVCAMKLIILWFPPYRFALLAGLTNLAGYLGATFGEVPLTYFVKHYNWRHCAYGAAILGVILTILIALFVRDKPYNHNKAKRKRKQVAPLPIFQGIKRVIKKPTSWINGAYGMLMVGPTSAFAALWGVSFLKNVDHLSSNVAAGALSAIFIGVACGSPFFGWVSECIGKRRPLLSVAALGSMLATLCIIFLNGIPIYFIYGLCFFFGLFQSAHVLNFAIAKTLVKKHNTGAAIGFTNMAVMAGGAFLQPIIGFLLAWTHHGLHTSSSALIRTSFHEALVIIPICQLIAFLIAVFLLKDTD